MRIPLFLLTLFIVPTHCFIVVGDLSAGEHPNILWLTCEDIGRHLGCYDFPQAETPRLDKLAERGMRYRFAWSNYPVCAPARTTIITGCYAASLGAEQMRSNVPIPKTIKLFPDYLRRAGYYCTNNAKEDYNFFSRDWKNCWDVSNRQAHYKNRKPGQPFFAVFNFEITHESQIRNPYELQRNPDKTPVPKYHPNVPEIRRDWTQYHERIAQMDRLCGEKLDELDEAGLSGDTIIFFFGDHGSGMPRNKRTPLDCGLGVPMLVYFPPKFKHLAPKEYRENGVGEQLVSFVDLAPTVLSIAGIKPPEQMQGVAFAGTFSGPPREFVFGFRGRMDERADLVRSVSDGRHVYVRNFHPQIIYGARNNYMFQTRTTQVWRELYDAGNLPTEQAFFWELKPTEELYDLQTDPDEVVNLSDSPEHQEIKCRLREALLDHLLGVRDVHFLPENMLHDRFAGSTPYEMGHDFEKYPLEKILDAAFSAADRSTPDSGITLLLNDTDSAVRYWGAIGILIRFADTAGPDGTKPGKETAAMYEKWKPRLEALLLDEESAVRTVAAETLGRYGNAADVDAAVKTLLDAANSDSQYTVWLALEALDRFAFRCAAYKSGIDTVTDKSFQGRPQPIFSGIMNSIQRQLPVE
ncbi:MAG: sulfatase-like hydrolase/transferase [Planctomycetaceae bacterium]|nr:sulfatase-like hydrolase/transferase [Planctomycetaceae bacterium]